MSTPFRVDLEDLRFVLFDQLQVETALSGISAFADFDRQTYEAALLEASRVAIEVLHPINGPGDKQGCQIDNDGNVTTPKGYQGAWKHLEEGGWITASAPVELGGSGLPYVVSLAVSDMMIGAAPAFMMYPGLTAGAGRVLMRFAPESMRELISEKLFSGKWGGTMCLTEADAGSAVGDNRCKAVPASEPGVYNLEGEKIFISGGDQDLTENIIHLVLARTPGAPAGTKGLSLFLVPKFLFDEQGKLGERNGAKVIRIEHKMGINGSSTCVLALGAEKPCKAWLVGQELQGIALMFYMMNEARIGVAAQGEAVANAAYQYAVQYAKERVQGALLKDSRDDNAKSVTIINHPDVRRMLMTIKVQAETMRAALLRLALHLDLSDRLTDEKAKGASHGFVDLLTPVCKSHFTDLGYELATIAVQVYGGYGYLSEYPVEQLVRDAKIQSIYEGTNGIQALDLLGRKMRMAGGALFMAFVEYASGIVEQGSAAGFTAQAEAVSKALGHLGAAAMHLSGFAKQGHVEGAFLQAVPFQRMFGVVLLAIEALHQAQVAKRVIAERGESDFLKGKLLNLDFYVHNILPQAVALGKTVQSSDESALDSALFA